MAIEHHEAQKHQAYWFDDGSLTLQVQNRLFRVHRSLICRHSRVLLEAAGAATIPDFVYILEHGTPDGAHSDPLDKIEQLKNNVTLEDGRIRTTEPILWKDFEELLRHLYHDEYVVRESLLAALHVSLLLYTSQFPRGGLPQVTHLWARTNLRSLIYLYETNQPPSIVPFMQTLSPQTDRTTESKSFHSRILTPTTPFYRVLSLLRISSPKHLDIPQIHELAKVEFHRTLPPEPWRLRPETHQFLYEGLKAATEFGFSEVGTEF